MTINNDFFKPFLPCIIISFTGVVISTVIVLSLIPIYIGNHSSEVRSPSPAVYTLYNLIFHVNILSISNGRAVRSSPDVSALTLGTLQLIQNQLNNNFATIQATSIITAATYKFDVSELIVNLKILFYKTCTMSPQSCDQTQKKLIEDILNKLGPLNINGQCYSSCLSSPTDCSLVATSSSATSPFTIVTGSDDNSVAVADPCLATTVTSTQRVNVTISSGRRRRSRLLPN